MRIGIFGGTINDGTVDDVVEEARRAEADGFASYWASQIFAHDALTALAVVGREVPRIELGTGVVPTFPRHPMMLAQQCLTTNQAAGGRLCLGIGLSHKIVIESMFGLSFDKPVRHLREYLSVLGPLSRGEPVSFDGDDYKVHAGGRREGLVAVPDRRRRARRADAEGDGRAGRRHLHLVHGPEDAVRAHHPDDQRGGRGGRPAGAPGHLGAAGVRHRPTSAGRASGRRRSSPSTGSCPATGRCSTARAQPGRPTSPSSAPPTRSPSRCSRSARSASPTSPPSEFGANPDEVEATRAALVGCLTSR